MRKKIFNFVLLISLFGCISCNKLRGYYGTKSYDPVARPVNTSDIVLPDGYKIEMVTRGLNYPTSLTFDDNGDLYVIEAGYSYGEVFLLPALLKIDSSGRATKIAEGESNGPWTSVDYYNGNFYISEGGTMKGGRILKVEKNGKINYLLNNLPSYGDHHTNGALVGKDGYIYFGQGTATNSGVVGKDNYDFGWLARKKDFHDIPCADIILSGQNFETQNVFSEDHEKIVTGAYVPYGTQTSKGQTIKGQIPCTGAVMRIPLAGGDPELVAWGFRNPYGLSFSPDGILFVSDNGFDMRGSRPIFGAGDLLWKVENNTWYGWPDFSGEDSLASGDYRARDIHPKSVLQKHPNIPPKPIAQFGVHSSSNGFDFSENPDFGFTGKVFIAQFGDMSPDVGSTYASVGFKIVMVDVNTGMISDFAVNKGEINGPASQLKHGGLERPVEAKFNTDGTALYIVDFGVMEITEAGAAPKKNTGVIWKITKK